MKEEDSDVGNSDVERTSVSMKTPAFTHYVSVSEELKWVCQINTSILYFFYVWQTKWSYWKFPCAVSFV